MLAIRALALFFSAGIAAAATNPALTYSTYLHGAFTPTAIAADSSRNVYLAGTLAVNLTARFAFVENSTRKPANISTAAS